MKYVCTCGRFETDDPSEFYPHMAEGNFQDGAGKHGRILISEVSEAPKQTKQIQSSKKQKSPKVKPETGVGKGTFHINRQWTFIIAGAIGFIIGIVGFLQYIHMQHPVVFLGLILIIMLIGSPIMIFWAWRRGGDSSHGSSVIVVRPEGDISLGEKVSAPEMQTLSLAAKGRGVKNVAPVVTGNINSLNIYARAGVEDEKPIVPIIANFEYVKSPLGQPWKLTNDGRHYHLHIIDIQTGNLRAFGLQDAAYVDPAIFARFLENPAQKRYIEYVRESLAKWIGPGILAVMDCVGFVMIIILMNSATAVK
jgi:hypothetical protein